MLNLNNRISKLVERLKHNDIEAFIGIYDIYKKRLLNFSITLLKSKEDSEEAVQDVFIKLWESRHSLDETLSFDSYLYTITKNITLNKLRSKRVQFDPLKEDIPTPTEYSHNDTEAEIIYSDLDHFTQKAVETLPPRRKLIYNLSRKDGFSNQEIAEKLNISPKTVEAQMTKALRHLKNFLKTHINPI